MRWNAAIVALIVATSFACAGTEAPSSDPDAGPADPQPSEPAGGGAQTCPPAQVQFTTRVGSFQGLRETIAALDTMSKGQDTKYQMSKGTKIPCQVDLTPLPEFAGAIDTVILTNDGRGLLFSSGTGTIGAINILDLETGIPWEASTTEPPRLDGDGILVLDIGRSLPDAEWPKECEASLKGQMSCMSWEEIRWQAGVASPTGTKGAVITE